MNMFEIKQVIMVLKLVTFKVKRIIPRVAPNDRNEVFMPKL